MTVMENQNKEGEENGNEKEDEEGRENGGIRSKYCHLPENWLNWETLYQLQLVRLKNKCNMFSLIFEAWFIIKYMKA